MKKTKRIKKMNWFYATVVLVILGISLLSYGVYSSNPSTRTLIGTEEGKQHTPNTNDDPAKTFSKIKQMEPSIFNIMDLDPNAIDQVQDSYPVNQYIGLYGSGEHLYRQSGSNDREPWNGFEIIIMMHGTPTEPLYIGIRDNADDIDPYTYGSYVGAYSISTLPNNDTLYWVGFEETLTDITSGTTWSIVLFSHNDGGLDNFWAWACDLQNPYSGGEACYWDFIQETWHTESFQDMCFRTYTIPNGGGDPPEITITTTYSVIPMFFGSLSLVAAIATGSKFYFFM